MGMEGRRQKKEGTEGCRKEGKKGCKARNEEREQEETVIRKEGSREGG